MDREKQEKEVMEYVSQELNLFWPVDIHFLKRIVKAIMRRYDLIPRGE